MQVNRPVIGQKIFFRAAKTTYFFTVKKVKGDLLVMGEDSVMRLGGSERWLRAPSSHKFVGIAGNRFFTTLEEAINDQAMAGKYGSVLSNSLSIG